ncbi:unnamed protein product [Mycena citricolor]|uniref:Uncharacterized protein n=1 Tax=Mycena citricolor TaxID=2018698 RepID=A0AAD2H3R7_9AGAR|nr:unnamed protein product [Mycena citricolor]
MASSAQPLKFSPSTPAKSPESGERGQTPPAPASKPNAPKTSIGPGDISSPHELTAFVESLLEQLDTKFDEMSSQILERMSQMSTRVDALEASIHDIINGERVGQQVIQGQPVILEGVLDISKEARDAIAEGKAQNGWHPFEMGIRPDSPTGSSGSSSGSSKAQQLQQEQQEQQQQHSAGQVHRPLSSSPPFDPPEMTSPSLSAKTVMPRDPDGRRFAQSITIPARPDAAPPLPLARDSLIHSLRRQPDTPS